MPIFIVLLTILFSSLNPDTFPTLPNAQVVAASNSLALVLALGALVPLIAGEFDLSMGFTLELSAVISAVLLGQGGMSVPVVLLIVFCTGIATGLLNGLLITRVGISSFIATLGVGSLAAAASIYLTGGAILIEGIPRSFVAFGQGNTYGIPNMVMIGAVTLLVFWVALENMPFGRNLLAVGLSRKASELVGIRTKLMITTSFVISGAVASLCGFLALGRIGAASSGIGTSYLLPALAACFLGATTVRVGRFNPLGTAFAVLLVAIGLNGLQLYGVPGWAEPAFNGCVLLIAVGASSLAAKRR
ncbi:ABC transporter permease subunit [Microvirga tunisiensis]|uniref:ABC transporter permease subunit n=1 Tax=Microvirga tunisiensis TaxID=2108360 RepID=UPI001386C507